MFVFLKESHDFSAVGVIVGMVQQIAARARTRQLDLGDLADGGAGAVGHHHHAVGEQDRLVNIMGDADGGDLGAAPDLHQHLLQLPPRQAVEHAEGLIQQQQLGRQREGAGDADALAHAVRHIGGNAVHRIAKADAFKVVFHHLLPLGLTGLRIDLVDADGDVLLGGQPGKQVGRLEHHGALGVGAFDVIAVQGDRTFADRVKASGHRQHGGFAAAGMADQADKFAALQGQVEILDHGQRAFRRGIDLVQL